MIYQILCVFVLLITDKINASGVLKMPDLSKEDVKQENEERKEKIKWSLYPSRTEGLPIGIYYVYKRDGEVLKHFNTYVADTKGAQVTLSEQDGFKWSDTYVIYGNTHKGMKFKVGKDKKADLINLESLSDVGWEFIRSSEKCFKQGLIIRIVVAVVISLAVLGCCVFGCFYARKRKSNPSRI